MSGIKSHFDRYEETRAEAVMAWNWLKKTPEYIRDYQNDKKTKSEKTKTGLLKSEETAPNFKKKWGFYPLLDPNTVLPKGFAPMHFMIDMARLFDFDPVDRGMNPKDLTFVDLYCLQYEREKRRMKKQYGYEPPKKLPKKITIELNPKMRISTLLQEIESYLERVQKVFKVTTNERPREQGFCVRYMLYVCEQLNYSKATTRKLLEKNFKYKSGAIAKDSVRRSIDRMLEGYKGGSDKKV